MVDVKSNILYIVPLGNLSLKGTRYVSDRLAVVIDLRLLVSWFFLADLSRSLFFHVSLITGFLLQDEFDISFPPQ